LRTGTSLAGSSSQARLTWTGKDNAGGSGIAFYLVARSVNGGSYSTFGTVTTPAMNVTLANGTSYRFRVRAVDHEGNTDAWAYGPTIGARLVQQTSSAVHYASTWTTSSSTSYSGGSLRSSKTAGASASYTFTGRSIAFVTTKSALRGKAKVYVNGVYQTTVDLVTQLTTYRTQVWAKTWSTSGTRTIRIVVVGTAGRPRVDLDAFAVIK